MKPVKIYPGYENWSELDLLTALILGEAGGEIKAGQVGVALTVKTRHNNPGWWGRNWREVMLCLNQFDCWMDEHDRILASYTQHTKEWIDCAVVAQGVYTGTTQDYLGSPTHYHEEHVHPDWAPKMKFLGQIGHHLFYRDLSEVP